MEILDRLWIQFLNTDSVLIHFADILSDLRTCGSVSGMDIREALDLQKTVGIGADVFRHLPFDI